jgi:hypothetical protein
MYSYINLDFGVQKYIHTGVRFIVDSCSNETSLKKIHSGFRGNILGHELMVKRVPMPGSAFTEMQPTRRAMFLRY